MLSDKELYDLFHENFEADFENGILYWKKSRGKGRAGARAGFEWINACKRKTPQVKCGVRLNYKMYYFHRVMFMMYHGYMPKYIDHIDMDVRNNSINNLREATVSQNNANKRTTAKSGYKGVSARTLKDGTVVYDVQISEENCTTKYLGTFRTLESAVAAFGVAAVARHGEFANF